MKNISTHQSTTNTCYNAVRKALNIFTVIFLSFFSHASYAGVTVTPGSGGTNICSTVATSSTTLGAITITEGLATDFSSGSSSFTLNPPPGWTFVVSLPTVTSAAGGDVTIGITSMSAGAFTINFNASGTTHIDVITITNLRVQATSTSSAAGNIFAATVLGIAGITVGAAGTNFASLSILTAVAPSVVITSSPGDTICTGGSATFTPAPTNGGSSPTYQWFVNGSFVGSGGTFSSGVLVTGNKVTCQITASGCVSPAAVMSNTVTMRTLTSPGTTSVTGAGTFCTSQSLSATLSGSGTIYFQGTTAGGMSKTMGGTPQTVTSSGTYYFNASPGGGCWGTEGSAAVVINPVATANAGAAQTVCAGNSVTLAGSIGGSATSSLWSAPSGTFSDATSLTATYTSSATAGAVTLTLTTAGPCAPVTSTVNINVVSCPASVNSVIVKDIKVYPNPAASTIQIDAPVAVNVSLVSYSMTITHKYSSSIIPSFITLYRNKYHRSTIKI